MTMPATVPAIETRYAGCRFRSRLEARWAVLLDTLRIDWEYEPQGFALPSGPYLPDFWLPSVHARSGAKPGVWLEIKPDDHRDPFPGDERWHELTEQTATSLYLARGIPRPPHQVEVPWIWEFTSIAPGHNSVDWCLTFCSCHGSWSMQYGPESNYHTDNLWHDQRLIDQALTAARSARFEHGESG